MKNYYYSGVTGVVDTIFARQKSLLMMLLLVFTISFQAQSSNLNKPKETTITLNLKDVTIDRILEEIESQTHYVFLFSREILNISELKQVSVSSKNINEILQNVFEGSGIGYQIIDNKIILSKMDQQAKVITGVVLDETGEPLPGVSVVAVGTTIGTSTDFDGNFSIEIEAGAKLQFSFMGYSTITLEATPNMSVSMAPDAAALDEVVVVGYGVEKKKLTTGASLNVKGDAITKQTTTNTMEALQGISPGVSITRSSAQPGSATKVNIRGIGTIGDSSPLYLVDGVVVDDIDYLSPSDIATLDVLKDAASAAIYGSRAANGVILVTTKKGRNSDEAYMNVNFDAYMGIQNLYNQPEMLNAQQFMEMENEGRRNDGAPEYDYESIVGPYVWDKLENGWTGTNWMDEMKNENSVIQNYALNITGGSSNSVYSFGASYHGNEGVFGKQSNSDFKRLSLRLNSEHTIFKNENRDILKFGENLTYTNTDLPSVRLGNIYVNDVHNSIVTNPLMPVYDENGEYSFAIGAPYQKRANPVAMMDYLTKYNTKNKNKIVGNFYFDYQPIKDLVVRSSFGFQGNFDNNRSWTPSFELSEKDLAPYDKVHQSMYNKFSYTFTNTATYNFDIQEKNHFTALIGTEMNRVSQSLSVSGTNENGIFNDPDYAYLDNYPIVDPALTKVGGMDSYGHSILSYFGRVSYNYDEKYMFTVVARADGSSNFADGNRWGFFPSLSAGWVLSNENFLEDSDIINFMKLRASWGENGNQNIGAFQYSSTISYQYADYAYGPDKTQVYLGAYPARVPNPDITWETSVQSNIGVDMYFADSKLKMNLDWYSKTTKDWLVTAPIIASSGTDTKIINGGEVSNKGIEIALGYNDNIGDFRYGVTASFAYNDNEVVSIANDEGIIHGQLNVLTHGMPEMYRAEEGYPVGYFWGFETDGIIQNDTEADDYNTRITSDPRKGTPSPGDFRYKDINGDGKIDDEDKVMLGDPNPKYNFGLQLSLEYKNFYMNVTGTGQGGMQIAKSYKSWNYSEENYTIDVLDRWHGEGTSNTYPKLSASGNQNMLQMSDFFVEDATYFRISNLTLGYSLPAVKGTIFKGGKVYVAAKNLITFTGYSGMDPEVGYGPDGWASGIDLGMYPQSRSFLLGVNLSF